MEFYRTVILYFIGKIGDVVIVANAPQDMRIHSLDAAFDIIPPCFEKECSVHPSTSALIKAAKQADQPD